MMNVQRGKEEGEREKKRERKGTKDSSTNQVKLVKPCLIQDLPVSWNNAIHLPGIWWELMR